MESRELVNWLMLSPIVRRTGRSAARMLGLNRAPIGAHSIRARPLGGPNALRSGRKPARFSLRDWPSEA